MYVPHKYYKSIGPVVKDASSGSLLRRTYLLHIHVNSWIRQCRLRPTKTTPHKEGFPSWLPAVVQNDYTQLLTPYREKIYSDYKEYRKEKICSVLFFDNVMNNPRTL